MCFVNGPALTYGLAKLSGLGSSFHMVIESGKCNGPRKPRHPGNGAPEFTGHAEFVERAELHDFGAEFMQVIHERSC